MGAQVFSLRVHQIVLGSDKPNEVAGSGLAHVQQLKETVLRVGARFPEVDFPYGILDGVTVESDALAVGLHVHLNSRA